MKRVFALLLAAALCAGLLAGCGKAKEGTVKSGLFYDASGISPDTVLLTVDGRDVTADRYFYWLTDGCDSMKSYYTKQNKELDWDTEFSGQKLGDYVKKQALTTAVLYAVIESWANKYGCTVTDEDRSGINTEWEKKAKQYGGEQAYLDLLANLGLDQASAEQLSEDYYLYKHLYEVYSDPSGKLHPDDATLKSYASDNQYLTVDEILISTEGVGKDDTAALKEKRERAEMILGKLNASSNPLEYFTTLAGTYSDDNRDDYPHGFTFSAGSGTMPDAFESAAKSLEENKWSGIVETDEGFYIILRKPLDMDTVSADYFDHLLRSAADSAKIKYADEYNSITAADFYNGLIQAREKQNSGSSAGSAAGSANDNDVLPHSSTGSAG